MKTKRISLTVAIFLFSVFIVRACDCWMLPFCDFAFSMYVENPKVYEAEPIIHYGDFVDFKIVEHIYGLDTLSYDTISIKDGHQEACGLTSLAFNIGEKWVISFDTLSHDAEANFPVHTFHLCIVQYLKLENDSLYSKSWSGLSDNNLITSNLSVIDYATFKEDLEELCSMSPDEMSNQFSIFPNPTSQNLQIQNNFSEKVNYQFFDASGRLMQEGDFFQQNNYEIEMNDFPQGIYFLKVQSGNYCYSEKIVKI